MTPSLSHLNQLIHLLERFIVFSNTYTIDGKCQCEVNIHKKLYGFSMHKCTQIKLKYLWRDFRCLEAIIKRLTPTDLKKQIPLRSGDLIPHDFELSNDPFKGNNISMYLKGIIQSTIFSRLYVLKREMMITLEFLERSSS